MAPFAESVFVPLMSDGRGADLTGRWFGTGPDRGIALMFTLAGLVGVAVTVLAWTSRSYPRLVPCRTMRKRAMSPAPPRRPMGCVDHPPPRRRDMPTAHLPAARTS